MSQIKERIQNDLKEAMKAGETQRKDVLRFVSATLKQVEVDTRETLTDEKITNILQTEVKKRRESLSESTKAGRDDLAAQTEYEINLIKTYLPAQLSPEELRAEVAKAVAESGATIPKDMGAVMKILSPRVKGKAEGKDVQEAVQAALKPQA
jgi:uncharacterized protein